MLACQLQALSGQHVVYAGAQGARGSVARVLLLERAGGRVARVDVARQLLCLLLPVECLKVRLVEKHLAAHHQQRRRGRAIGINRDAQWQAADGAHVGRDLVTGLTVAARGRLGQQSVFISQDDAEAVQLGLERVGQ